jgi:hypothetical protein
MAGSFFPDADLPGFKNLEGLYLLEDLTTLLGFPGYMHFKVERRANIIAAAQSDPPQMCVQVSRFSCL